MLTRLSLTLAATLLLVGCDHDGWKGRHHADTGKIADQLKASEAQWQKDYAAKDVDAIAGQYAGDAAIGSPGETLATNSSSRRAAIEGMTGDPNFALTFGSDRILVAKSGDLASSRGHYTLTMTDKATNKPVTGSGSYLTVFQRQDDGSWKAVEDFITPGPAPAAAAAK